MHALAFTVGLCLAAGATCLLISDAWSSGHWSVTHALQPLLVFGTVAAAVWVHKARWHLKPLFLALASLGSLATVWGTLGRTSETREQRHGEAQGRIEARIAKRLELESAKASQKAECIKIGPRCQQWLSRVDSLSAELASLPVVTLDPRSEALSRLASLVGFDPVWTRTLAQAVDPLLLPAFLELGSVLFMIAAFPGRRQKVTETLTVAVGNSEIVNSFPLNQLQALQDFRAMKEAGAQKLLAQRWNVSPGCVSKWMAEWEQQGLVKRNRDGRVKVSQVLALPPPPQQA
jgi:hypothetical protein